MILGANSFIKLNVLALLFCFCDTKNQLNITNSLSHKGKKDDCEILLTSFAFATSNFTFCAIRFARPIKLCQFCVEKFIEVEKQHSDILTLIDEEGEDCRAMLINLDRLQVIETGFGYVVNLWTHAQCNYCYECDGNGNPTNQLNWNTKEILRLSNETQTCIEQHQHDLGTAFEDPKVCSECKNQYLKLNSHYDSLKEQGFCMDIVDMMNTTRAQWSTELGCCIDRKHPEWLFLVSSVVVTCLPLVFYLGAFLFVTRKEQTLLKQRRLLQEEIKSSTSVTSPD